MNPAHSKFTRRQFVILLIMFMLVSTMVSVLFPQQAQAAIVNVTNGIPFTDTNGNVVHAHGGGMLKQGNYYYWLGENRDGTNLVSLYRSTDLKNWEFRAHLLSKSMGRTGEQFEVSIVAAFFSLRATR